MHPAARVILSAQTRNLDVSRMSRLSIFRLLSVAAVLVTGLVSPSFAQDSAWIQVEAYPRVATAEARAESYGGQDLPLAGYKLGTSGWFALVVGPFPPDQAEAELSRLIGEDLIPRDSFLSDGGTFEDQFWPRAAVTAGGATVSGTADSATPEDVEISLLDDAEPAQTSEDTGSGAIVSTDIGAGAVEDPDAAAEGEPAPDATTDAETTDEPVEGTAESELAAAIEAQEQQLAVEAAEAEAAEAAALAAEEAAAEAAARADAEAADQAAAQAAAQAEAEAAAAAEIAAAAEAEAADAANASENADAELPETDQDTETARLLPLDPPSPPVPDETIEEARASEKELTREAKKLLQTALKWEDYYDGAIDGDYGRITRRAMSAWQESKGIEPTGVLTTAQRGRLLSDYNAILAGLDLAPVTDTRAGITVNIPTALVKFDRYVPPFAHYEPVNEGDPTRVILISQSGDQASLFGLYDIMQTLEIVPPEGLRDRGNSSFRLEGQDSRIISETYAELRDGEIKGYTLIWPIGDEKRRLRVLENMRASFTRLDGVLPDVTGDDQSIDLVAGLKIRRPAITRSGFYVDAAGSVLTTTEAVDTCTRITLDSETDATIANSDADLGLALLTPAKPLSPTRVARFRPGAPRLQSEVSVAGYSYGGVLGTPTMTFGQLADIRGLDGNDTLARLALATQPGDAGGPVFDNSGAVIGMLVPASKTNGQQLPPDVSFATDAPAIATFLSNAGTSPAAANDSPPIPPEDLTRQAIGMTVLVSCWK